MVRDKDYDVIINALLRGALLLVGMGLAILYGCRDQDSLSGCSSRNQPQHWNGSRWTCDRDQQ